MANNHDRHPRLERLAADVSDGTPVDWDAECEHADDRREQRLIGHLRLVEQITSFHRSQSDDSQMASVLPTLDAGQLAPAAGAAAAPATRWGRLEIREKLGEGGFGDVFRARDPNLDRDVALKLLRADIAADDSRATAVLEEGRMLARVRHPNVITVHGAEIHDGRVGVWMELVGGQTLAKLLEDQGRFGAREAALVGIDLCRALSAVHGAGLLHRDVKASNAMRDQDGRFVLMDFGAGQRFEDATASRGAISGTPMYIAPEVFAGETASVRSDVYSMGVLLYHIVSGGYPLEADSMASLREGHATGRAQLLRDRRSDLPESFVAVVERAIDPDPGERFATAGELERALSASLGLETAQGVTAAPADGRRPPNALAVVGAAALLAVVVAGWWLSGNRRAAPAAAGATTVGSSSGAMAGAYTVQASLLRLRDGQLDRLEPGDTLQVGDELQLELNASRDVHVYIFNEDELGNAFALYPLPGYEPGNPLPAGDTHRLPGSRDGVAVRWQVTTPGGREHLVVLASPEPLAEYEAELARLRAPTMDDVAVALPAPARERLRGIGGLTTSTEPAPDTTGTLFEMARRLSGQAETVEGVWMREIELLNPGE